MRDVAKFEPDISSLAEFKDVPNLNVVLALYDSPLYRAWRKLFKSLTSAYEYLVFVPWLVHGGADLVAVNAVRAAIERHGANKVLLIITDFARIDARDWLPANAEIRVFSDYGDALGHEDRVRLVELLVVALTPSAILNVNSHACWEIFRHKGKALSSITKLYAALFCRDYTPDGRAAGYADTHFRECLPFLQKIYVDNEAFIESLVTDYGLLTSLRGRLALLRQPISPLVRPRSFTRRESGAKPSILWAGRFCRQKNIDLVIEIAERAPEFQFHVYGSGEEQYASRLLAAQPRLANFSVKGSFASIEALPTDGYAAFLFTSLWEGMPTTLINIAALGLPIVASNVGGVAELVDDRTGWLVSDHVHAEAYVQALREVWEHPAQTVCRVRRMSERVHALHSWESYMAGFGHSPSLLD